MIKPFIQNATDDSAWNFRFLGRVTKVKIQNHSIEQLEFMANEVESESLEIDPSSITNKLPHLPRNIHFYVGFSTMYQGPANSQWLILRLPS